MEKSFTAELKDYLGKIQADKTCDVRAEAYGLLLFAPEFSGSKIRFISEQPSLIKRIPTIFKRAFSVKPESVRLSKSGKTQFIIENPRDITEIFKTYGLEVDRSSAYRLNRAVLEEDCCRAAFLRGAFLAGGSIADPEKRYHLEMVTPYYNLSRELISLLQEMGLEPKVTTRRSNYVLYVKSSEQIEMFLTLIGAANFALRVMSAKVEKDVRNKVNRKVNCETANIQKTADAAYRQCQAIRRLQESGVYDTLSDELRAAADARMAYPDYPLTQLALTFSPPLSRATLNYRLKKLVELDNKPLQ